MFRKDEADFAKFVRKEIEKQKEEPTLHGIEGTEAGWLMSFGRFRDKPMDLEPFQLGVMNSSSRFRSILKSRQIGFSWLIAAETISRAHLRPNYTAVCISYNLDDAKLKIQQIREFYEELPLRFQKKLVVDSKTEIAFASNSGRGQVSRIISMPAKAPRGRTGDVYLDELAHCQADNDIYTGATAVITRSGGQLTIGSTPLGRRGIFHDIHTQEFNKYPNYSRHNIPWWLARHFCSNVEGASREALHMPTEERVERFGSTALKEQYAALPIDYFQQEFELVFQDERVSFFPYDLILPCAKKEYDDIAYTSIESLALSNRDHRDLHIGFDVGRSKHPSELYIFEKEGNSFILRYSEEMRNMPFPAQRERLNYILETLDNRVAIFRIDSTGLGMNLYEDLKKKFRSKVEGISFTQQIKADLANNLKILFEEKGITLSNQRDTIAQIHSIKQRVTASGNSVFDVEKNQKHHADKMWAIALACFRAKKVTIVPQPIGVRLFGGKPDKASAPAHSKENIQASAPAHSPPQEAEMTREQIERRIRAIEVSLKAFARNSDIANLAKYTTELESLKRKLENMNASKKEGSNVQS